MATNYEILKSCSRKQMEAFIHSLVSKEVSRYIDWSAWLNSEDPEPVYIGTAAFSRKNGEEEACFLLEETEADGRQYRTVYQLKAKGCVEKETLLAHLVRKAEEEDYPEAPLPDVSREESDLALETLSSENEAQEKELDDLISQSIEERAVTAVIPAVDENGEPAETEETVSQASEEDIDLSEIKECSDIKEENIPEETEKEAEELTAKLNLEELIAAQFAENEAQEKELDDLISQSIEERAVTAVIPAVDENGEPGETEETDSQASEEDIDLSEIKECSDIKEENIPEETEKEAEELTAKLNLEELIAAQFAENEAQEKELDDLISQSIEERAVTAVIPAVDENGEPAETEETDSQASEEDIDLSEIPELNEFEQEASDSPVKEEPEEITGEAEEPAIEEITAEKESLAEEIETKISLDEIIAAEDKEDDGEDDVWKELEAAIKAVDQAEDDATNSMKFEALQSVSDSQPQIDEIPEIIPETDEDEENEFFARGRIELLKESLFDDEEPPEGEDLVFMETTAIELPANGTPPEAAMFEQHKKEPEEAEIEFASIDLPEDVFEAAGKAESTSSLEMDPEEDADSFFEKLKALSEAREYISEESEREITPVKQQEADPQDETVGLKSDELKRFLSDIKKESMLYDPDDPEDQELPTIAFSTVVTERDRMF